MRPHIDVLSVRLLPSQLLQLGLVLHTAGPASLNCANQGQRPALAGDHPPYQTGVCRLN